ncbi:MAG: hypothetical protein ACR2KT_03110 [Methylocella sp.]
MTEARWRRAVDDAGRFLDAWGVLAVKFDWTPADLFDVPREPRAPARSGGRLRQSAAWPGAESTTLEKLPGVWGKLMGEQRSR